MLHNRCDVQEVIDHTNLEACRINYKWYFP
jgi:hypothetical protein